MKMRLNIRISGFVAIIMLAIGLGCNEPAGSAKETVPSPGSASKPVSTDQGHLEHAQPKLATITLQFDGARIEAEMATNRVQIQTGMMHRTKMEESEGMLFVFARAHQASFYMRNTLLPLSCAYINPEGVIMSVHDMEPLNENPITATSDRIQYVLETRQGWFERHGIGPGDQVWTEKGSLKETFFGRR